MGRTKIPWASHVWNFTHGCTKVSRGCANCYAETVAGRFAHQWGIPQVVTGKGGNWTGRIHIDESKLDYPTTIRGEGALIFVDSMSDLFHQEVPFSIIDKALARIAVTPQHTFIILTKRPERAVEYFNLPQPHCNGGRTVFAHERVRDWAAQHRAWHNPMGDGSIPWPLPNLWLLVSVEDQKTFDSRVAELMRIAAAVRGISAEPLLGEIDPRPYTGFDDLKKLDWIIAGPETGPNAHPAHPAWFKRLHEAAMVGGIPFFWKGWGGWRPIDKPWEQDSTKQLGPQERWLNRAGGQGFHGQEVYRMRRVRGKADMKLDGFTYTNYPEAI